MQKYLRGAAVGLGGGGGGGGGDDSRVKVIALVREVVAEHNGKVTANTVTQCVDPQLGFSASFCLWE